MTFSISGFFNKHVQQVHAVSSSLYSLIVATICSLVVVNLNHILHSLEGFDTKTAISIFMTLTIFFGFLLGYRLKDQEGRITNIIVELGIFVYGSIMLASSINISSFLYITIPVISVLALIEFNKNRFQRLFDHKGIYILLFVMFCASVWYGVIVEKSVSFVLIAIMTALLMAVQFYQKMAVRFDKSEFVSYLSGQCTMTYSIVAFLYLLIN